MRAGAEGQKAGPTGRTGAPRRQAGPGRGCVTSPAGTIPYRVELGRAGVWCGPAANPPPAGLAPGTSAWAGVSAAARNERAVPRFLRRGERPTADQRGWVFKQTERKLLDAS